MIHGTNWNYTIYYVLLKLDWSWFQFFQRWFAWWILEYKSQKLQIHCIGDVFILRWVLHTLLCSRMKPYLVCVFYTLLCPISLPLCGYQFNMLMTPLRELRVTSAWLKPTWLAQSFLTTSNQTTSNQITVIRLSTLMNVDSQK